MKVSFFIHRWKKESEVISLEEFVNDIRGPRWKVATEAYRGYLQRGMQKEAADIKEKMNGIVAAGTCRGGHAAAQVVSLSGWMMFDFDHSGTYTGRLLELLRALPYVGVAFISISGEGVKALVRIEVDTLEEYKTAYKVVMSFVAVWVLPTTVHVPIWGASVRLCMIRRCIIAPMPNPLHGVIWLRSLFRYLVLYRCCLLCRQMGLSGHFSMSLLHVIRLCGALAMTLC